MNLQTDEYYWVMYEDELQVGYYNSYGSWELHGWEELLPTSDLVVISHIKKPTL